jgi:hypothetical protein
VMNSESFLVFLLGVVAGMFLIVMIIPEHKKDCDTFGALRFGEVVYTCAPKIPDKR